MINIKELEKAHKEGRLIILPCPLGTPVYEVYEEWCFACTPEQYTVWIGDLEFELEMLPRFGDSIFLTKEEAQAVMDKLISEAEYEDENTF